MDMLVIYDDLYLRFGTIKFKGQGSSGGHNGVQSIIDNIGKKFNRLRLGIGYQESLPHGIQGRYRLEKFVLERFTKKEETKMKDYLGFLAKAVMNYLQFGLTNSMEKYNRGNFEI